MVAEKYVTEIILGRTHVCSKSDKQEVDIRHQWNSHTRYGAIAAYQISNHSYKWLLRNVWRKLFWDVRTYRRTDVQTDIGKTNDGGIKILAYRKEKIYRLRRECVHRRPMPPAKGQVSNDSTTADDTVCMMIKLNAPTRIGRGIKISRRQHSISGSIFRMLSNNESLVNMFI